MTKYLFVGGSADGQRVDLDGRPPVFLIPVATGRKPLPVRVDDPMPELDDQTEEREEYVHCTIRMIDEDLHYYRFERLSEKNAVKQIFERYPRPILPCRCHCHR